jgi:ubiquinol-cytochrome c reductase cytochrome c subunit
MTSEQSKRPLARLVPGGARAARGKLRRRLEAAVRLIAALTIVGGLYSAYAPGVGRAEDVPALSDAAKHGKELYETSCITCHGTNAQGVQGRGPSLIGAGSAAVEFQVGTGRMPMTRQEAQAEEKPPQFNKDQTKQIGQYIQELGGGPQLPAGSLTEDLAQNPEALARGGELFRLNCTSCHGFGGGGGALSSGKYAPALHSATEEQLYAAMLTGPQNMPVFGDNEITPEQKREIITYVSQQLQQDKDPGGLFNLGRYGPVTEGLAIFGVGMVILIFTALWIAGKS